MIFMRNIFVLLFQQIDSSSPKKENPLVLMAQACNNIGKELMSSIQSSASPNKRMNLSSPPALHSLKTRKSTSPPEARKSLKRSAPASPTTGLHPSKRIANNHSSASVSNPINSSTSSPLTSTIASSSQPASLYFQPTPFMFDSFLLHHLSKSLNNSTSTYYSSPVMNQAPSASYSLPTMSHRSAYLMDSILAPLKPATPSFVCNWMETTLPDGYCGQRFTNQYSLLEHLCASHTNGSAMLFNKSLYSNPILSSAFYSSASVGKL